jgi:hypothetical protein
MSWDQTGKSEHSCPCGKGVWAEITESDDWGRSRTIAVIECEACKNTHRIEAYDNSQKNIRSTGYRIIQK